MKPVPRPTTESRDFWAACAEQRLTVQGCKECGHRQFPPRAVCIRCHSPRVIQVPIDSDGHVHSFTVVHRAPNQAFRDAVPYVLALIEFAVGVRMMMNMVDCEPHTVAIGMRVRIVFERRGDPPQYLPQARPA